MIIFLYIALSTCANPYQLISNYMNKYQAPSIIINVHKLFQTLSTSFISLISFNFQKLKKKNHLLSASMTFYQYDPTPSRINICQTLSISPWLQLISFN